MLRSRGAGYFLGINAAFHDSSVALVADGTCVAAAEEERFTRVKHGKRPGPFEAHSLPFNAMNYCLEEAGISLQDVGAIGYSADPALLDTPRARSEAARLCRAPDGEWVTAPFEVHPSFLNGLKYAPIFLAETCPSHLTRLAGGSDLTSRWHFWNHHLCHAASAFLASGFRESAILTLDGRGETASSMQAVGIWPAIRVLRETDVENSIGLLVEEVTEHLGYLRSSDEHKVTAMAAFGNPRYTEEFAQRLSVGQDGLFVVNRHDLESELGPARQAGEPLSQRHFDIAASLQNVLEVVVLDAARRLRLETHTERLCMAGGVALNCVLNGRLKTEAGYTDIFVPPAAGDAGTALGAALLTELEVAGQQKGPRPIRDTFLGPAYDNAEIEKRLQYSGLQYRRIAHPARVAAALLERNLVVGWFQGRMEFGPRALGARSILASPLYHANVARINSLKGREPFQPVAPAVLRERVTDFFSGDWESPFMLFATKAHKEAQEEFPAVCHADGTARIQTVSRIGAPLLHELVSEFEALTGIPIVLNTSFNLRGEPIVQSPRNAIETFVSSSLDALVIGDFVLEKPAGRTGQATVSDA